MIEIEKTVEVRSLNIEKIESRILPVYDIFEKIKNKSLHLLLGKAEFFSLIVNFACLP